jgi:PAS domain S-box-containing protein
MPSTARTAAIAAVVSISYVAAARVGFGAAFLAEQVTSVWAPTGIAQAALLLCGIRLWPAIWIGAFAANALTNVTVLTAAGIATGNTLEAVAAAWILQSVPAFDLTLKRTRDAVAFILVAVVASPVISASVGVTLLCANHVAPWGQYAQLWREWWLGDALGALIVGPAILTSVRRARRYDRWITSETVALVLLSSVITALVTGRLLPPALGDAPPVFIVFPLVILAAVRLGQPATALVTFAVAAVLVWNTMAGYRLFNTAALDQNLFLVHMFMAVLAGSGLLLAAATTERRMLELGRLDQQTRTRAILETALDAVISMDHNGRIVEFNPAAERMFGYQRSDAIGQELGELIIPPTLRNQHRTGLQNYLETGRGPFIDRRVETKAVRANGQEFPVEVSITRVPTNPPMFTGFVRDVTDRAEAEQQRRALLEAELVARREAESANHAKDEFLATLSHELRTPLNAIVGWTRMLLDGILDEQSARRALTVIDRNAQAQAKLVTDLLDVSRIITGKLSLNLRPIDLASVVGAALDTVRPAADAKRIRLTSTLTTASSLTIGDFERLQQVVWNLLSNAIKFTHEDGLVDVQLSASGNGTLRLTITDSGIGIAPEVLPHVFDRFWQADGSPTRQHGGLGLGLAIVRHVVDQHGGAVYAESAGLSKGTRFVVELPGLSQQTTDAGYVNSTAPQRRMTDNRPLGGCRILIVENEDDSRTLMAAALTHGGAAVRDAATFAGALALLNETLPDVVLADIGLPDKDGYALLREIRAMERGRRVPVAAVTAYARPEDREKLLAAGFDAHIPKPAELRLVIETVLRLWAPPASIERGQKAATEWPTNERSTD